MKKIILVVSLAVGLNLSANANAEFTSECTLNGNGDYQCNFENKGKKKGSTCVHMLLAAQREGHSIFVSVKEEKYEKFRAQLSKDGDYCHRFLMGTSEGAMRCISLTEQLIKELSDEAGSKERLKIRADDYKDLLSEQKKTAVSSGKKLGIYIKENLLPLSYMILGGNRVGLSGEICSGIVEPNDLRERHGTVRFTAVPLGYKELDSAHSNLSPVAACKIYDEDNTPWGDVCGFTTVSTSELHDYIMNAINSAPQ